MGFIAVYFFFIVITVLGCFSLGPDLTDSYPPHLSIFISTVPTLVSYLLSSIDIITLITSYPTSLAILYAQSLYWHKYFTNLVSL
jgi:hypothetical protein